MDSTTVGLVTAMVIAADTGATMGAASMTVALAALAIVTAGVAVTRVVMTVEDSIVAAATIDTSVHVETITVPAERTNRGAMSTKKFAGRAVGTASRTNDALKRPSHRNCPRTSPGANSTAKFVNSCGR